MQNKIYKYRLKLKKNKELRFISHLDWQNLILKIFRRCELKLVLSQGFNKMPKVSYSPALPIFLESDCELVNFQTQDEIKSDFIENFKKNSPNGIEIVEFKKMSQEEIEKEPKSLENLVQWAQYEVDLNNNKNIVYNLDKISYIINTCLSSDELLITKKTKKGIEKTINYRSSLKSIELREDKKLSFVLKVGQNDIIPALRADEFLKLVFKDMKFTKIKRVNFFDTNLGII